MDKRIKWTKERVFEESKKYISISEFQENDNKAYQVAKRYKWLSEMTWLIRKIKPNGYWTKERVFEESKKYITRGEFQEKSGSAYVVAQENKWLDEMTWLVLKTKPKGYWTKERVFEESKKYIFCSDFQKNSGSAYSVAQENKWLDEMTWLIRKQKHNGYWTKERVFEESKKYSSRGEFQKKSKRPYIIACKNKWLDEMTWLILKTKPNGYWTKERVFEESKKYITRTMFSKGNHSAYTIAYKNKWLDEMTWLVNENLYGENAKKIDNVYAYEFIEFNSVYIGRTINPQERFMNHKFSGTVFEFCKLNNISISIPKILETNITILEGQELEGIWVKRYKEQGWNILNKMKCGKGCGSLGSLNKKWSKKKVFEESKKYSSRSEFSRKASAAYRYARKNKWLDEMTWLVLKTTPKGYWTKERVFEESKKYSSRSEFQKFCSRAYYVARINKWLDEMFLISKKK